MMDFSLLFHQKELKFMNQHSCTLCNFIISFTESLLPIMKNIAVRPPLPPPPTHTEHNYMYN